MSNPRHAEGQTIFVSAFRRKVEEVVSPDQNVEPACVGGIGMEGISASALIEDACTWSFLAPKLDHVVVVWDFPFRHLLLGERDVVVAIEVAPERRHPLEAPAHTLLERLDLGQWRSRNHNQRNVAIRQMNQTSVKMIGHKRAAWAAFFPSRTEHEVVHNQLASAVEEFGERLLSVRTIEHILLFNFLPWQFAALPAQFIS